MTGTIECPSCDQEFSTPAKTLAAWLTCPHCGARRPNPHVRYGHRESQGHATEIAGFFGTVLIVAGSCGTLIAALIALALFKDNTADSTWAFAMMLAGALTIGSGACYFRCYRLGLTGQTDVATLRTGTWCLLSAFAIVLLAFFLFSPFEPR